MTKHYAMSMYASQSDLIADMHKELVELREENAKLKLDVSWRPMSEAPTNGRHVILAIETAGGWFRSVEGAFMNGKWMNVMDLDTEPLCWRYKPLVPDVFLPWTEEYKKANP